MAPAALAGVQQPMSLPALQGAPGTYCGQPVTIVTADFGVRR